MVEQRSNEGFRKGSTSRLIVDTLMDQGVDVTYDRIDTVRRGEVVTRRIARFSIRGKAFAIKGPQIYFCNADGSIGKGIDGVAIRLFRQKDMVKSLLRHAGFPVPEGMTFSTADIDIARFYFTNALRMFCHGVCIKPVDGNKGRHIHVGVGTVKEFDVAFRSIADAGHRVMVEEVVDGGVYRFTVVDGEVLAVRVGVPQNVVGDGESTIDQLVEAKRAERRRHLVYRIIRFQYGEPEKALMRKQGFDGGSVPAMGEVVYLGAKSNTHAGAEAIDCTDTVHPSYRDAVGRAVASMPDIKVCGADVMIKDIRAAASTSNYSIIELNTGPGFVGSSFPWRGEDRDIAGRVVDCLRRL